MRLRFAFLLAGLLLAPAAARADVKPHALCSDGMVLQQKSKVKVWGKADPGEKVTVAFRGQEKSHPTDESGNWVVTLDSGHRVRSAVTHER